MSKPMSRAAARFARVPTDEPDAVDADLAGFHATSLFRDDIRPEASGKVTIIGHYPGET